MISTRCCISATPSPVSRGLTATYVSNHFPGWTWNGIIAVLSAAGVVSRGGGTLHCNPAVGAVHFDSVDSWLVEWEDGQVTRPGYPPGWTARGARDHDRGL